MRHYRFWAGLLSLLMLMSLPALAQGAESLQVIGSGIVNSWIVDLAEDSGHSALKIETVGTAAGIDEFCNGDVDLATAIRAIRPAESAICGANDVVFSEFLVGHHILALAAHADAPAACLTANDLNEALKPSASNLAADWSFYDPELTDLPLTLFVPEDSRIDHMILDSLVAGDGLRKDVELYADAGAALAAIRDTEGALGFLPWSRDLAGDETVSILEFSGDDGGECAGASVESVEDGSYSAALSMYLLVNRARLGGDEGLADFMRFVTDASNAPLIEAAGVNAPSQATYELNARVLADEEAAGGDWSEFVIPPGLSGGLQIVGAASAAEVLDRVADSLSQGNDSLEITLNFLGRAHGLERLCAGEADIAVLDADLLGGELDACADSAIITTSAKLGAQATVLLGNAADAYASCLTAEQIVSIWRAESAESLDDWSMVDPAFPALPITLFGMSVLDQHTDILLQATGGVTPPVRRDTETDFDPLYRAAAVGNVPGALTYMSWHDYQRVLANEQANIQLVAVDAGAGCVTPSPTSIQEGSYPLSRPATLLIRQQSLGGINTQAYLWSLYSDDSGSVLEREGFVGASTQDLASARRDLQRWFAEAEAMFPAAAAEGEGADAADAPADDSE